MISGIPRIRGTVCAHVTSGTDGHRHENDPYRMCGTFASTCVSFLHSAHMVPPDYTHCHPHSGLKHSFFISDNAMSQVSRTLTSCQYNEMLRACVPALTRRRFWLPNCRVLLEQAVVMWAAHSGYIPLALLCLSFLMRSCCWQNGYKPTPPRLSAHFLIQTSHSTSTFFRRSQSHSVEMVKLTLSFVMLGLGLATAASAAPVDDGKSISSPRLVCFLPLKPALNVKTLTLFSISIVLLAS